ncbi:MAG: MBL fold metallo-hydrolase [Thermodesulfobacteria bacterium]|nr:MBL fold metallo-hydrolase [Thermodesulfobacteriota bacterium]
MFSRQKGLLFELVKEKKHHLPNGRFVNPWFTQEAPALSKIIKWKVSHFRERSRAFIPVTRPPLEILRDHPGPLVCFLGHGSVLLKLSGRLFLLDPILGHIGGLVKRYSPPPLSPGELPPVDFVVYSHAHRDHFDRVTLASLPGKPVLISPLNFRRYLSNTHSLVELDWLEVYEAEGWSVRAVPVQHWSKRGLLDTNTALWAGFILESDDFRVFFGGDTGYFFGFEELGEAYGPFDLALLPAGAFLPRWLMAPFHMSPEEAVRAAEDLRARRVMPIHWGAYRLGDEELDDPPKLLKRYASRSRVKPLILYPGETVVFEGDRVSYLPQ